MTETPANPGKRVLIIDDEQAMRQVLSLLLPTQGYTVKLAGDGEEGLAALAADPDSFDIVLTDMVMPRLGGLEVLEEMQKRNYTHRRFLMSGTLDKEPIETAIKFGVGGIISKPFVPAELFRLIEPKS